jgi:hypothetical protein
MSKPRGWIRSSETNRPIDFADRTKPTVVGRLIDNNHLIGHIPDSPAKEVASVRWLIQDRINSGRLSVEDAKTVVAALGIGWRGVGDGPIDAEE